jgi:hypothetical protein
LRYYCQRTGCKAQLQGDEACQQGKHFLSPLNILINDSGVVRNCLNDDCNYNNTCQHHDLQKVYRLDNVDLVFCRKCKFQFRGLQICQLGEHFPDSVVDEACYRQGCSENRGGASLYQALADCYKQTGNLRAICRRSLHTVARAEGWNEKLMGFKVPKPKPGNSAYTAAKMGRQIIAVYYQGATRRRDRVLPSGRITYGAAYDDYRHVREWNKSRWANFWYPDLKDK